MVGSFILQGMKKALKVMGRGARGISKMAGRVSQSKIYKGAAKRVRAFGLRMSNNVRSKRWWARAVRVIRSSQAMLGVVGKVGASLKRSGGLLKFLGRGLSIFDTDYRSPKEFRREMKAKEKMVKSLRAKRLDMIKKEQEAQKELKSPVEIEDLETSEEKLNVLAQQLSLMKEALAEVRANTFSTTTNVKGFEAYQVKANEQLADAINHGAEANMKTALAGLEDVKDSQKAVAMSSTESIVGDITAKIDSIEDQRKEEEEFRRKNDWKRKFLKSILWLADWLLNWPFKLMMLALKVGAIISGIISLYVVKYWEPIKKLMWAFKNGFAAAAGAVIYLKLRQFGWWLMGKIVSALKWLLTKVIGLFSGIQSWFVGLFKILPSWLGGGPDGIFAKIEKGIDSASDSVADKIAKGLDFLLEGIETVSDKAGALAKGIFNKIESAYAESNDTDTVGQKTQEALKSSGPDEAQDKIKSVSSGEDPKTITSEEDTDKVSTTDNIKSKGGLTGMAGDFLKKKVQGGLETTSDLLKEHNVGERVTIVIDNVKETSSNAIKKTKAVIEQERKEILKDTETFEKLDSVANEVSNLKQGIKEILVGQENNKGKSNPVQVEGAKKTAFKESANQYNNLNQRS